MNPVGEILSGKGKYATQYKALYKNNSVDLDAHIARESTKEYLLELIKRRKIVPQNNPTYYGMRNSTTNYATEIYRLDTLSFQALGANRDDSYFQFPNWANKKLWDKIRQNFGIGQEPIDRIESRFK